MRRWLRSSSDTKIERFELASKTFRCYAQGGDGDWQALCLDLDIAVQGGSFPEVFAALQEAISLYLETVADLAPHERHSLLDRPAPLSLRLKLLAHALGGRFCDNGGGRRRHQFAIPVST